MRRGLPAPPAPQDRRGPQASQGSLASLGAMLSAQPDHPGPLALKDLQASKVQQV